MNRQEAKAAFIAAGGRFHGPNIETGTMPEETLLPFLCSLSEAARKDEREAIFSGAGRLVNVKVEQPAAVEELTDDEIAKAMGWTDLGQLDEVTYDGIATSVLIKDIRAVIDAHEAKRGRS